MVYQFSDRMATLQPSLIREILKSTSDPSVISFAAGNPAPDAFPVADVQRIAAEILAENGIPLIDQCLGGEVGALLCP